MFHCFPIRDWASASLRSSTEADDVKMEISKCYSLPCLKKTLSAEHNRHCEVLRECSSFASHIHRPLA
jgi:hypothetical protein